MKAIVHPEPKVAKVIERPVPKLRDDYILVKVVAIALNPTDWNHVAQGHPSPDGIIGTDYAGIVEEVGSKVTKGFRKGDRIAGWALGGNTSNPEDGAFAEYIVVKGDLQIKVPDHLSFEEAATFGCGVTTVGQGLYEPGYGLGLALPSKPISKPEQILIYGGSTATGTLAIQFLKASGYDVITTCSPKNFDLVKSLGASEVFDYNEPDVGKKINEYTKNGLKYAWDCISLKTSSTAICSAALSTEPGSRYGNLLPAKLGRDDVKSSFTVVYVAIGETFVKGAYGTEGDIAHFEQARKFIHEVEALLNAGKLKPHPISLREGGFEGAIVGLKEMEEGRYSGEKLVYRIA